MPVRDVLLSFHHRAVRLPRADRVAAALARRIGRARSLLDVGCDDGRVARSVARAVGADRVAGVDLAVNPDAVVEVQTYDGDRLPWPDGAFEVVTLSDVLHHASDPRGLLREALRVAARAVAVKDHFRFGPVSDKLLLLMDLAGNAKHAIAVRGTYFTVAEFTRLVTGAGGRIADLEWPLRIHDLPYRLVTSDRLQFAATIVHARGDR